MIYFLDLDRTIFNTHAFINDLVRSVTTGTQFERESFPKYLYPDALEFLKREKERGSTLVLVTRGDPEVQKTKAEYLGILPFFNETCFVPEGPKAVPIASFLQGRESSEESCFVDDTIFELMDVQKTVPRVKIIRMRRPDSKNVHEETPEMQSVSSFDELA